MKLSQEELAGELGLNRGNIASYEKGTAEPKICNLLKFATFFKVSLLDLTRRNLDDEETLRQATDNYGQDTAILSQTLENFTDQMEELEVVIQGIYACHAHKKKQIAEADRDMQIIIANMEHLHDVSQTLLRAHRELIEFVANKKHCG